MDLRILDLKPPKALWCKPLLWRDLYCALQAIFKHCLRKEGRLSTYTPSSRNNSIGCITWSYTEYLNSRLLRPTCQKSHISKVIYNCNDGTNDACGYVPLKGRRCPMLSARLLSLESSANSWILKLFKTADTVLRNKIFYRGSRILPSVTPLFTVVYADILLPTSTLKKRSVRTFRNHVRR